MNPKSRKDAGVKTRRKREWIAWQRGNGIRFEAEAGGGGVGLDGGGRNGGSANESAIEYLPPPCHEGAAGNRLMVRSKEMRAALKKDSGSQNVSVALPMWGR